MTTHDEDGLQLAPGWEFLVDYLPRISAMTAVQAYDFVCGAVYGHHGDVPLPDPVEPQEVGAMLSILLDDRSSPTVRGHAMHDLVAHLQHATHSALGPDGTHRYLSTGCLHGKCNHCRSALNQDGWPKEPGTCKFCPAQCECTCHGPEETGDAALTYPLTVRCTTCMALRQVDDAVARLEWIDSHGHDHRQKGEDFAYEVLPALRMAPLEDIGGGFRAYHHESDEES